MGRKYTVAEKRLEQFVTGSAEIARRTCAIDNARRFEKGRFTHTSHASADYYTIVPGFVRLDSAAYDLQRSRRQ